MTTLIGSALRDHALPPKPEKQAREQIDALLCKAGWIVGDSAKYELKEGAFRIISAQ